MVACATCYASIGGYVSTNPMYRVDSWRPFSSARSLFLKEDNSVAHRLYPRTSSTFHHLTIAAGVCKPALVGFGLAVWHFGHGKVACHVSHSFLVVAYGALLYGCWHLALAR